MKTYVSMFCYLIKSLFVNREKQNFDYLGKQVSWISTIYIPSLKASFVEIKEKKRAVEE